MFPYSLGDGAELRFLQIDDAQEFFAFVEINRAFISQWLSWPRHIQTLDDARDFLRECEDDFARDGLGGIGIWQDGKMAGGFAFFPLNRHIRQAEFGYWLGKEFTGRGLMTRALRAVLAYLFDEVHVNRAQLRVELNNTASRQLAERVGFCYEGITRDGWIHDDAFIDVAVYSMLAKEWHVSTQQ